MASLSSPTPSSSLARIHGLKKRVNLTRKKRATLNLEEPCKEMCRSIRRQSRSKIPRTQRVRGMITNRSGRKRRFGKMCKKTCKNKAKENIRRSIRVMRKMNKERKQCNKILSRRNAQGGKDQRSKTKLKQRRKRKRRARKCTSKSRRQGRFGLSGFSWSSSWGTPLVGLGGLGLVSGLGLGLGTGLGVGD